MKKHKRIIGVLFLLLGFLFIMPFTSMFGSFPISGGVGGLLSTILTIIIGVLYLFAGYGFLTDLHWCESIAIPMGVLALILFPVGTVLGVYWGWYQFNSIRKK